MTAKVIIPAIVAAAFVAGCQTGGTGQTLGTVGGAVAGGAIGSNFGSGSGQLVATGAGAVLGAWLGGQLGAQFDQQEQAAANAAAQNALNTGGAQTWQASGSTGQFAPTSGVYYDQFGRECRQYAHSINKDGQQQQQQGVACRQPNGTWAIVQ